MIFREKLVNASTGEVRQGNVLDSSLGEVEQIMIDSSLCSVMYYWVKTPDSTWRKTQYYELVENLYSITYKVNDSIYQTYYLQEGDDVPVPDYTPGTGYTWSGWLNENIPTKMPASDIVVESYTEQTDYAIIYYIDGRVVYSETHHYNDSITAYVPETREHYVFSGWSGFPQSGYMPAENVTVTGTYEEDLSYVLSYYVDASVYTQQSYMSNDVIDAPDDPQVEEGYSWSGWIDLPSLMPAYDSSVHSVLTANQYILDYYVDSSLWNSLIYNYKQNIVHQTYTPAEGYLFSGWVNEPETMPAINHYRVDGMTQLIPVLYNVYWYIDSSLIQTAQYESGTTVTSPVCEDSAYEYDWNGYDTFVMPSADTSIYGEKLAKSEPVITYTVTWYIDSSLIQTGEYAPGSTVTSPVCQDPDYVYDWGEYDTFTMASADTSIYGEKIAKSEPVITYTVTWYMDNVYLDSSIIEYTDNTYVTSPTSSEGNYKYEWFGYDTFKMTNNDISIYGSRVLQNPGVFRIAIEQIDSSVTPQVTVGYCSTTGNLVENETEIDAYIAFLSNDIYNLDFIGEAIPIKVKFQQTSNFINWNDLTSNTIDFNNSVSGTVVDENNIVHYPDGALCRGIRLAVADWGNKTPTTAQKQNAKKIAILLKNPTYIDPETGNLGILVDSWRTYFTMNNTQSNCKCQIYGSYESFHNYIKSLINNRWRINCGMIGIHCSILNNVVHAHKLLETSGENYITSGVRMSCSIYPATNTYIDYDEPINLANIKYPSTFTIETLPVNTSSDGVYMYRWAACTHIIQPPVLSGTTARGGAYSHMFDGCTSLVATPDLSKKTSVGAYSYYYMFTGSTSLTQISALPTLSLLSAVYCYQGMFEGCTSLTHPGIINATIFGIRSCARMYKNCTSLTSRAVLTVDLADETAFDDMYYGCTSLQD